jgi:hypothetical protein
MKVTFSLAAGAITLLSFTRPVLTATYPLSDAIVGSDFYKAFNFEAISDPSHGRVYVFFCSARSLHFPSQTHVSESFVWGRRTNSYAFTDLGFHTRVGIMWIKLLLEAET